MKSDDIPHQAAPPEFESGDFLETIEVQATLREWNRNHHGGGAETRPLAEASPPAEKSRPRRRRLWLFWKR